MGHGSWGRSKHSLLVVCKQQKSQQMVPSVFSSITTNPQAARNLKTYEKSVWQCGMYCN